MVSEHNYNILIPDTLYVRETLIHNLNHHLTDKPVVVIFVHVIPFTKSFSPGISIYQIYDQWVLHVHLSSGSSDYTCGLYDESRNGMRKASPQCGSWRAAVTGWTSNKSLCIGGIWTPHCPPATLTPVPQPTIERTKSQISVMLFSFFLWYLPKIKTNISLLSTFPK